MSHGYTIDAILDALNGEPLSMPVVLTVDEYEYLREYASIASGTRMERVCTLCGHPIRVATWAARVKGPLTDIERW